jgi:hypothetical protein
MFCIFTKGKVDFLVTEVFGFSNHQTICHVFALLYSRYSIYKDIFVKILYCDIFTASVVINMSKNFMHIYISHKFITQNVLYFAFFPSKRHLPKIHYKNKLLLNF